VCSPETRRENPGSEATSRLYVPVGIGGMISEFGYGTSGASAAVLPLTSSWTVPFGTFHSRDTTYLSVTCSPKAHESPHCGRRTIRSTPARRCSPPDYAAAMSRPLWCAPSSDGDSAGSGHLSQMPSATIVAPTAIGSWRMMSPRKWGRGGSHGIRCV
jgi:hypothetical protein